MIPCLSCGESSSTTHIWFSPEDEPAVATEFVYPQWSGAQTCMCNLCYEAGSFESLTSTQVAVLHYMFSSPFSEQFRGIEERILRLKKSLAIEESGEVLAAYGHALWKAGKNDDALIVLRKAVSEWKNFFGASKAWGILRRIDPNHGSLRRKRLADGVFIKSVSEEFPQGRLRKNDGSA